MKHDLSAQGLKKECTVHHRCGGCPLYTTPVQKQQEMICAPILEWLSQNNIPMHPKILSFDLWGFRDRCDLQFREGILGLFSRASQDIVAITHCPKIHPLLNNALSWLWENPPPLAKASMLLRRAPCDTIGLWIDAANIEIKSLLEEATWLEKAHKVFSIEIGQKHKRILKKENGWTLQKQPVLFPWFATFLSPNRTVLLYSTIKNFTQPSMRSNMSLVETVYKFIAEHEPMHWLEYGSGTGNFTHMLSQHAHSISIMEPHPLSRLGLQQGFAQIKPCSYEFISEIQDSIPFEGALLDPPRNGLGADIHALALHRSCRSIVYVSCHFESMKQDMDILLAHGYELVSIQGIAQFPNTEHCEWVCFLKKSEA